MEEKVLNSANLQIHYYLEGNSHSMDAITLNKAEGELLKIFEEVSKILEIQIVIETQALEEGGVRSIYKFLTKKKYRKETKAIFIFFAGILANVITNVVSDKFTSDSELENLQKEELQLKIEELQLRIEELKRNSVLEKQEFEQIYNVEIIEDISQVVSENNKIKNYKSNFYKNIRNERKLVKVSTQLVDKNQRPILRENIIERDKFNDLIIDKNDIDSEYLLSETIEIISPVLKGDSQKWKGIYRGENIIFNMKDEEFKKKIIFKNLKFSTGTKIICDLEIKRKINSEGKIILGSKNVYSVTNIIYPEGTKVDL